MDDTSIKTFKIAILDDEKNWCLAIQKLLEREERLCVVGIALTQTDAVKLAKRYEPDLFIVDMKLKSSISSGITATIAIREVSPSTEVIILTSSEEDDDVINATSVGAIRYISKEQCQVLLPEILQHLNGGFNPNKILSKELARLRQKQVISDLSDQELEVIKTLSRGVPRSKLSEVMHKSESTIKSQIGSALKKLGVTNAIDAVKKIRNGGVFVPDQKK